MFPPILRFNVLRTSGTGLLWYVALLGPAMDRATAQAPGTASPATSSALTGTVAGTVRDASGVLDNALVTLTTSAGEREAGTASDGSFRFASVSQGPFRITAAAPGHTRQAVSDTLQNGQALTMPAIVMPLAAAVTSVQVHASQHEVAQAQIHQEEKQRVLGIVPNFHTSYVWDAAPLTAGQKFQLSGREVIDPVTFVLAGVVAGVEQDRNTFKGYGQGAAGYGKRYGAAYGDFLIGNILTDAAFPSVFHQDPRYFYKGTGTVKSRAWYAITRAVISRGDNGKWQPGYAAILGDLAAGGISNAYYPASDRGAGLTFRNWGIGIAGNAGGNLIREFVLRRLTPHTVGNGEANP